VLSHRTHDAIDGKVAVSYGPGV